MKSLAVYGSNGKPIILNHRDQLVANYQQRIVNSLGYEIDVTSLTGIIRKVSEQKFFEIPPADYVPVIVGEGAWSSNLTAYRSYELGSDFEDGIVNTGANNARVSVSDAGVDSVNIQIYNWETLVGWSIFDLQQSAKSGNWDLVSSKSKSAKKKWDLGVQRIAFLGARGLNGVNGACLGLLNQPGITVNTVVIPQSIGSMTPAQLKTFTEKLIEAYRTNCNRSAWPDRFVIPESDYNSLASQASPDFPIKSTLELLEEAFKLITRNAGFKILPLAYADAAYSGQSYQQYALYNYDDESMRMTIPVDITSTVPNSLDNFNFQSIFYGQFSGLMMLRPQELMYFRYTA